MCAVRDSRGPEGSYRNRGTQYLGPNIAASACQVEVPVKFQLYTTESSPTCRATGDWHWHWRDRAYLIIDEKSMVGLKELHWIDSRLRTIMSNLEREFGGVNAGVHLTRWLQSSS
jgi:hypothetical protein